MGAGGECGARDRREDSQSKFQRAQIKFTMEPIGRGLRAETEFDCRSEEYAMWLFLKEKATHRRAIGCGYSGSAVATWLRQGGCDGDICMADVE